MKAQKEELLQNHPEIILLDSLSDSELESYLRERNLLGRQQSITGKDKPGEGNMNLTWRVSTTKGRSLILKQSRPWVEKYPQIAAPWDRVLVEAKFYKLVASQPSIAEKMPRLLHLDSISRILALEDLGESSDLTSLYSVDEGLTHQDLTDLCQWLSALHGLQFDDKARSSLVNREMRDLNHEHIFHFPLQRDDGLDLDGITPGLKKEAEILINDRDFATAVRELGELYLENGKTLLHGDYFPGSWLQTPNGIRIIDPEFGFFGPAEFDAGVMLAQLYLSDQEPHVIDKFKETYRPPPGFDTKRMQAYAGVEIMRRLIGIAQLPLPYNLEKKSPLLKKAKLLVLS